MGNQVWTSKGYSFYAGFEDRSEVRGEGDNHKVRHTSVFRDGGHLRIVTKNSLYPSEYRPTKLTRAEAATLRDAIDRFLADDSSPVPPAPLHVAGTGLGNPMSRPCP